MYIYVCVCITVMCFNFPFNKMHNAITWVNLVLCGSEIVQTLYCSLHSVAVIKRSFVYRLSNKYTLPKLKQCHLYICQGAFNSIHSNNFLFHVLRRILMHPPLTVIPVNTSLHLTDGFIQCIVGAECTAVSNTHCCIHVC